MRRAALIAVPDGRLGEKSCAVIVPDVPPPSLPELKDFLVASGLADFKQPDRLEVVDELPITSVGKVDKRALRARFGGPA